MKLLTRKTLFVLATIITLSGCGGGGDESNNSSNGDKTTISGQFFSSHDTGKFFSTEQMPSYQQYGRNAKHCYQSYNDYYFESENTMVFGNPNLPESDFKLAASWVENNLNSALSAMEISKAEYFINRYSVRLDGL